MMVREEQRRESLSKTNRQRSDGWMVVQMIGTGNKRRGEGSLHRNDGMDGTGRNSSRVILR